MLARRVLATRASRGVTYYYFVCKEHRMRGYRPRSLGWLATVFVVATTLMVPWPALAQDATPAAGGEPTDP